MKLIQKSIYYQKLLNSIIAIYSEEKDRWTIIKHTEITNPSKLVLINFTESIHELGNHYDTFIIQKTSQRKIELINKMQNPHKRIIRKSKFNAL